MPTLLLWVLVVVFVGAFVAQVTTRVRLILAAPNTFSLDQLNARISRFVIDVIGQRRTIVERPVPGLAHAFVFWGFIAFGLYTATEFLAGLGIVDLTHTAWFAAYRTILTPFAVGVLCGIVLSPRAPRRSCGPSRWGRTCRSSRSSSDCSSPR